MGSIADVTLFATASDIARLPSSGPRSNSTFPSDVTTFVTKCGSWWTPSAANVPTADAMSSGRTGYSPRMTPLETFPSSFCRLSPSTPGICFGMPALWAMSATDREPWSSDNSMR